MSRYIYKGNIDKLLRQNKAITLDYKEGCLLDNMLIETKRGYMAIVETYATPWASVYTLYFSKNEADIQAVWDKVAA